MDYLARAFYTLFSRILTLWPTGTLPAEGVSSLNWFFSYWKYLDKFLPMATFLQILLIVFSIYAVLISIKIFYFIYRQIRFR